MREGWEIHRFDEVFDLQMGKTPDRKEPKYFEGSNVWVSIRDIDGKEISDSNEHISDEAIKISNIRKVKKGTVIMSFKLTVGKCAIATKDLYTNEAIMAFNLQKGFDITPDFLYYYLSSYKWEGANKAVMGFTLNKATISQNKISFPPLSVQQSIVSELDILSGLIAKHEEQLKAYDELAQSIFFDMFGDPVENEKGWEVKKLGEVCEILIGLTYSPNDIDSTGTIVLRSSNIQQSVLAFDDVVRVNCNIKESKFVKNGDILMCSRNGSSKLVGKVAKIKNIKEPMAFGAFMTIIRSIHNDFLFSFFLTDAFRRQLNCSQTATINQITTKMLNNIVVPLPPLSLQQSFAEKIEAIERQKERIRQSMAEAKTLFDSRMDYYFN